MPQAVEEKKNGLVSTGYRRLKERSQPISRLSQITMPSSENQDASGANASGEDAPDVATPERDVPGEKDPPGEQVVEPAECPNCGREFTGTYCPDCGQEADPSVSAAEVIGGFFRELVDLESGVWPTFVGLTVRPGEVLRRYLGGVRAGLISPGRYLLAAVVVNFGTEQFLVWIGASPPSPPRGDSETSPPPGGPEASSTGADPTSAEAAEGFEKAARMVVEQFAAYRSYGQIIAALVLASLLAVLLYRLFEIDRVGEALAVASFLVAHGYVLDAGANLLYVGAVSSYTAGPAEGSSLLRVIIAIGYAGAAVHQCFGPSWKSALKGVFASTWAFMEAFSVLFVISTAYIAGLILLYPSSYAPADGTIWEPVLALSVLGLLFMIPLLLHAGAEVYYRLR